MGIVSSNKKVYPSKIDCNGLFKVKLIVTAETEDEKGTLKQPVFTKLCFLLQPAQACRISNDFSALIQYSFSV